MMEEATEESMDENEAGMVDNPEAKMAHVIAHNAKDQDKGCKCNAILKSIIIPRVTIVRKRGDTDTQSHTSHTPTHSLCRAPALSLIHYYS